MRYAYYTLAFLVITGLSLLGFRGAPSVRPPLEIFDDMDHQAKYKPQAGSKFFADGRADRPVPAGTVPRGRSVHADAAYLRADDFTYRGRDATGEFARGFPVLVTEALLRRGQERYQIYCYPCHGALGDGNGITKQYGMTATPTFHDDRLRQMAEGEIYNTIMVGKNTMMAYGDKLDPADRWAVVAYVRALQRAQAGRLEDVPAELRGELK